MSAPGDVAAARADLNWVQRWLTEKGWEFFQRDRDAFEAAVRASLSASDLYWEGHEAGFERGVAFGASLSADERGTSISGWLEDDGSITPEASDQRKHGPDDAAWLIELVDDRTNAAIAYHKCVPGGTWVPDVNEATKYPTQIEAERVRRVRFSGGDVDPVWLRYTRAAEHIWVDRAGPSVPPGEP